MKIFIIGAGNAATCLGKALISAGHTVTGVWSRSAEKAVQLSNQLGIDATTEGVVAPGSDLVLLCLPDDALFALPDWLYGPWIMAHTSGSVSMEALNRSKHYGVFYPLQTLSAKRQTSLKDVPLCIEGSDSHTEKLLVYLAGSISQKVEIMNSGQRLYLHLAAVFANNFSNHMFSLASEIALNANIDPSLLTPLIRETAAKAGEMSAADAQTGPAVRNDRRTIAKHLELLSGHPHLASMYRTVSEGIYRKKYGKEL
jgi:predicted short-subunit dehydrogenase-like oxidoreductase (DUF2520 family)